jgi:hypothetical protein
MNPRLRLILAAVAFLGWLGYLGYAAATKSRAPIVSHIQAAAAEAAVVAEVTEGAKDKPSPAAVVTEQLWGDGPTGPVEVVNLPGTRGFVGSGKYLLYLVRVHEGWAVVSPPRSPEDRNKDTPTTPLIYPWSDDVRKQAEKLRR